MMGVTHGSVPKCSRCEIVLLEDSIVHTGAMDACLNGAHNVRCIVSVRLQDLHRLRRHPQPQGLRGYLGGWRICRHSVKRRKEFKPRLLENICRSLFVLLRRTKISWSFDSHGAATTTGVHRHRKYTLRPQEKSIGPESLVYHVLSLRILHYSSVVIQALDT